VISLTVCIGDETTHLPQDAESHDLRDDFGFALVIPIQLVRCESTQLGMSLLVLDGEGVNKLVDSLVYSVIERSIEQERY